MTIIDMNSRAVSKAANLITFQLRGRNFIEEIGNEAYLKKMYF
jgi:hypothetical protein